MSDPFAEPRARLLDKLQRDGIDDKAVLDTIARVPREAFVPETFHKHAYDDTALPIDENQTVSQPLVVAMMTQALSLNRRSKVLEVGTGSGYQAAILSQLCRRLYTVERRRGLLNQAEQRFTALGLTNVTTLLTDGYEGWPQQAPFDRIMVTAAAHDVPDPLIEQLADSGVLIAPVGDRIEGQRLVRVTKENGVVGREDLGGVRFVPLVEGIDTSGI